MDRELHRTNRVLVLSVVAALLFLTLTLKRQVLGWQLLLRGERVDSTVVAIGRAAYRVRIADGSIISVRKAGTLSEIFTGQQADVGDPLSFYWVARDPSTARVVRLPWASTALFLISAAFLLAVPIGVIGAHDKGKSERPAASRALP